MLTKPRLNSTEVLVSKALIDSNISHVEFVSIYNVLKDSDDMKKEIKNSSDKQKLKYMWNIYTCYCIDWNVEKIQKVKIQELWRCKMEELCFYQNVQCVIPKIYQRVKFL